jgi:AcrR family transcriptional regulator
MADLLASSDPKERILGASLSLLNRFGFGALSLTEIAKELGQTKQRTYYHFSDPETVLLELAQRWSKTGQFYAIRALADSREDGAYRVLAMAEGMFDWMKEEPELSKLSLVLFQVAPHNKRLGKFMKEAHEAGRERLKSLLLLDERAKRMKPAMLEKVVTSLHSHMYGHSFYVVAMNGFGALPEHRENCVSGLRDLISGYLK